MYELYSSYPSDPPDPMAAYEELYRGKCGCDTAACDVHELESVKEYIGPLCCNPDFVNVSSLLANDDCTDVQSMGFMEFLSSMSEDDGDGDHDDHDDGDHGDDDGDAMTTTKRRR